jgi:hypothetical protein
MLRTPAAQSRGCSGLGHQTKMPWNGHDCPGSPRDPGCSGAYVLSAHGFTLVLPLALLSQPPYYLGITWVGRILYQRTIYVDCGRIMTLLPCEVMSSSSARLITPGSLFILADFLRRCRHLMCVLGLLSAFTAASRTPPWLVSGWGCRGRRLSRVLRSLGMRSSL